MGLENYQNEAQKMTDEFHRLILEDDTWTLNREHHDIKVYTTYTPASSKSCAFKAECTINIAPERIIDIVHPFAPYRFQFDPNAVSCECLEELSHNTSIAYQLVRPKVLGIPFTGDSVDLFVFDKADTHYYSIFQSVHYDKRIIKSHGTRGWIFPSGVAAFKTEDPNVSKVISLWHAEFKAPLKIIVPLIETLTSKAMVQYLVALKTMTDKPYKRLGPEQPLCRLRDQVISEDNSKNY